MAVVGRDRELDRIVDFVDLTGGGPRVLLIEGDAGIGKTTLWRAAVEAARDRGHTVLACAAAGSETQLAFAALRDLLGGVFEEIEGELPPPQRRALAVTLLLEEPTDRAPEPGAIAVAVLTSLKALAGSTPTLLAIDDVQWLDSASATALSFVIRRLGQEQLAVLLARRTGEPAGPLELPSGDALELLRVPPLTIGALGRILHSRLEIAYPRPTLHGLHELSGGNPFYALELARALGDAMTPFRHGDAFPVPGSLHELVHEHVVALPPETLDALGVVASLSSPSLAQLGLVLGGDPLPPLAAARAAEVVLVTDTDVRFAHPLFSGAVLELVPAGRRREIHARLAGMTDDLEQRARHLALAAEGYDEEVAQIVEEGARTAFARGSPAAAATLARRARSLTPPTRTDAASRRALAEVDYEFAAGETAGASTLLAELLSDAAPGTVRARLLSRQARVRHFARDIDGSVALLREALAEASDDPGLRGEIEEGLAWGLLLVRKDLDAAAEHAGSAVRMARERRDDTALAEGLAAKALTSFVLGRPWEEAMEQALSLEEAVLDLRVLRHPSFALGYCLSCRDELGRARDVFDELHRRAAASGDESSIPSILNHLTLVECLAGRWEEADRHAEEGFARALESGQRPTQVSILAKRALVGALRGDLEDAKATAVQSLELACGDGFDPTNPEAAMARGGETAIWALGFAELSAGRAEAADRLLSPMTAVLLQAGIREPGELRCLPDAVEALVALGRLDEADVLLRQLEEWARRLARPSTLATAGRCRGLLSAAQGDEDEALAALNEAAATHETAELPFDAARTMLALGTLQRRARQRRAARETLQRAVATFDRLGARVWAESTRSELGRIGGRAPSTAGLTPTEQRIAELVAEGRTNREVAATLVVSVHTIEAALTSVYRKLEVRSRTELANKLAEPA